jgi:hypothetical protein
MTRTQTILGWLYLLVHVFVLPELLALYAKFSPDGLSDPTANLLYFGVGIVFCLTVMFSFLRGGYDVLADNLRLCLGTMLLGLLMDYALSGVAGLVLLLIEDVTANPNQEAILETAAADAGGTVKAVTIFLVPIVEEVLFRGVVFGSLRPRSRARAYVISVAVFALYHVWRYALSDPTELIYALQYVPVSIVLAWIYERSGTIWPGIFFHMGINAMSFYVMDALQRL